MHSGTAITEMSEIFPCPSHFLYVLQMIVLMGENLMENNDWHVCTS